MHCFTSTETISTIRDRETRTATSTLTQLLCSANLSVLSISFLLFSFSFFVRVCPQGLAILVCSSSLKSTKRLTGSSLIWYFCHTCQSCLQMTSLIQTAAGTKCQWSYQDSASFKHWFLANRTRKQVKKQTCVKIAHANVIMWSWNQTMATNMVLVKLVWKSCW